LLLVRTRIGPSAIHGIGLFAAEPIPRGTVIWQFMPTFDVVFDRSAFERLPREAQLHVDRYAYLDRDQEAFVLCGDDARFMNHSAAPNTWEASEERTLAARDIAAGEEITCDYAAMGPGPLGQDVALHLQPPIEAQARPLAAVAR
jgi:SET domain-containing protein